MIWAKKIFEEFSILANEEPVLAFIVVACPQLWGILYAQALLG